MNWLAGWLMAFCWFAIAAVAKDVAADQWVVQKKAEFLATREADGDSFGMTVASPKDKRVKRTYRLYGADCPETTVRGGLLAERIAEQAKHFGIRTEDITTWGKKAADFTVELLKNGKPLVITWGYMGLEAPTGPNDPKRHYALVEVTAPDGTRRMLHELLIENGLARAHGHAAPWPEKTARHLGEQKAREWFMKDLERLEKKAKEARRGIWRKAAPDAQMEGPDDDLRLVAQAQSGDLGSYDTLVTRRTERPSE